MTSIEPSRMFELLVDIWDVMDRSQDRTGEQIYDILAPYEKQLETALGLRRT